MVLRTGIKTEGKFHDIVFSALFHNNLAVFLFVICKDNRCVISIVDANNAKITNGILAFLTIDLFRLRTMKV